MATPSIADLDRVRMEFCQLMMRTNASIISNFVAWLDLKVAEYKVFGHMILNDEIDGANYGATQKAGFTEPINWPRGIHDQTLTSTETLLQELSRQNCDPPKSNNNGRVVPYRRRKGNPRQMRPKDTYSRTQVQKCDLSQSKHSEEPPEDIATSSGQTDPILQTDKLESENDNSVNNIKQEFEIKKEGVEKDDLMSDGKDNLDLEMTVNDESVDDGDSLNRAELEEWSVATLSPTTISIGKAKRVSIAQRIAKTGPPSSQTETPEKNTNTSTPSNLKREWAIPQYFGHGL